MDSQVGDMVGRKLCFHAELLDICARWQGSGIPRFHHLAPWIWGDGVINPIGMMRQIPKITIIWKTYSQDFTSIRDVCHCMSIFSPPPQKKKQKQTLPSSELECLGSKVQAPQSQVTWKDLCSKLATSSVAYRTSFQLQFLDPNGVMFHL